MFFVHEYLQLSSRFAAASHAGGELEETGRIRTKAGRHETRSGGWLVLCIHYRHGGLDIMHPTVED